MDAKHKVQRTMRLLQRAEGFLDLRMPDRAISELDSIADMGPFAPAAALLRGEALKSQERYNEALVPLKQAATMIPAPLNKRAWRSLSECYRLTGREELAEVADLVINAEQVESDPDVTVHFAVVPLPLVNEAIKLLLGRRHLNEATDGPAPEGHSASEE